MLKPTITPSEAGLLKKTFLQSHNVVILCHISPDGDAIGSSLALYEYLTRKGKNVNVIVPNYFPDFLKWMQNADKIIQYDRNYALSKNIIALADLIVVLDLNSPDRLGDIQLPFNQSRARKVLIDHHLASDKPFCDLVISRPSMSSTCELLYRCFESMGVKDDINIHCAEDIYAGLCTDTGRFSYNSNNPEIFIIISELMRKGIDKDLIIRKLFNQNTEGRYRIMGYILSEKLEVIKDLHASVYSLTREELNRFNYVKGDTEGIVNMPLEIKGQKLSISLREDTEKPVIWVSLRSYDNIPASEIAKQFFNGGGHFNAARGKLCCSMPEAIKIAHEAILAYKDVLCADI